MIYCSANQWPIDYKIHHVKPAVGIGRIASSIEVGVLRLAGMVPNDCPKGVLLICVGIGPPLLVLYLAGRASIDCTWIAVGL